MANRSDSYGLPIDVIFGLWLQIWFSAKVELAKLIPNRWDKAQLRIISHTRDGPPNM